MGSLAYKITFGNPRTAALLAGSVSIIQFSVETLCLICFAVYAATPISTVTKVFYALAAICSPLFLAVSVVFVYSISKDNHIWMKPWLFGHALVIVSEIILSIIAFSLLSDLHDIFHFFASAWSLAQFQIANQLFIGNQSSCTPVSTVFLPSSPEGVYFAALFSQQGANGIIAFFTILLLLKNVFNVLMLYVSYVAYAEIRSGRGLGRKYIAPARTPSYYDPHGRVNAKRQRRPHSINAVSK